jgi:EmrB/QacA subfamily drug resistance transporter
VFSHPAPSQQDRQAVAIPAVAGPSKWAVLATVGLGTFLSVLDSSIVNLSLPTIATDLAADVSVVQWVVLAYLLTITGLLLTFGRAGDLVGRERIYVGGMIVFAVGTVMCGVARDITELVVSRVVQGIGSAMVMSVSPALTASAFPVGERGRALGINSTIVAVGQISGPVFGGLLLQYIDWRAVFYLRVPLILIGAVLAWRVLKASQRHAASFDISGSVLLFIWLSALTLGVNQGRQLGFDSPVTLGLLAITIVGIGLFVWRQFRAAAPLLDPALFGNRLFTASSASSLLSFMSNSSVQILMPFFLIQILMASPRDAGLMLLPQPIVTTIIAPFSGWLSDKLGSRILATTGLAIAAAGLFALSTLGADAGYLDVAPPLALIGLGIGLFQSPNNSALLGSVPHSRMGVASGMLALMRNLGLVMGTAVAGAVWTGRMALHQSVLSAGSIRGLDLATASSLAGMRDAFVVAGCLCALGAVTSLIRGAHPRPA